MPKTHFENLKVYQLAETLADEIWEIVIKWEPTPKVHGRPADGEVGGRYWFVYCGRQWSGHSAG